MIAYWQATSLADNESRQQYAFVHMEQLQRNFRLKRFEDVLRVVANYQLH